MCDYEYWNTKEQIQFEYKMKNQTLDVMKHPYLGVEWTDNMKYNQHIDSITSKASRNLGFVKCNLSPKTLSEFPKAVKERAYRTSVCPKLDYSSCIWNPQQVTQIKKIKQVQRNTAHFVLNRPFNHQNPTSVTTMLQQLNWPTLEDRHRASDLILMYKVVNSLVAVPMTYLTEISKVHRLYQVYSIPPQTEHISTFFF